MYSSTTKMESATSNQLVLLILCWNMVPQTRHLSIFCHQIVSKHGTGALECFWISPQLDILKSVEPTQIEASFPSPKGHLFIWLIIFSNDCCAQRGGPNHVGPGQAHLANKRRGSPKRCRAQSKVHPGKLRWQWKSNHEWRRIPNQKWWFSIILQGGYIGISKSQSVFQRNFSTCMENAWTFHMI